MGNDAPPPPFPSRRVCSDLASSLAVDCGWRLNGNPLAIPPALLQNAPLGRAGCMLEAKEGSLFVSTWLWLLPRPSCCCWRACVGACITKVLMPFQRIVHWKGTTRSMGRLTEDRPTPPKCDEARFMMDCHPPHFYWHATLIDEVWIYDTLGIYLYSLLWLRFEQAYAQVGTHVGRGEAWPLS